MAKLTIKQINNVLNEFKTSLFISEALEKHKVNHYDFFEHLLENEEANKEYEKILNYNNLILEDKVAKECYTTDKNSKVLVEMIKANNKKKYTTKTEIDLNNNYKSLSDEELDELINKMLKKT